MTNKKAIEIQHEENRWNLEGRILVYRSNKESIDLFCIRGNSTFQRAFIQDKCKYSVNNEYTMKAVNYITNTYEAKEALSSANPIRIKSQRR